MDQGELPGGHPESGDQRSLRRFLLFGAPILITLFAAYWFFVRTTYEPILSGVPADEAAEIVKILEAAKVDYRLTDNGSTILVASAEADAARLELVGSDLPIRGQVGFELFNQSDMGLTEFAQKINYQRALQGELARTIMLLDGIRSVRVHLGIPERTVFRDQQSVPRASITLVLEPGAELTESRVNGVQRLVAGAIPEMTADSVAVLDGSGKVVSSGTSISQPPSGNDAVIEGSRQAIVRAVRAAYPALPISVGVALRAVPPSGIDEASGAAGRSATPANDDLGYSKNIRLTTPDILDDSTRADLIRIVKEATDFDRERGDEIAFLVGPTIEAERLAPAWSDADRVVSRTAPTVTEPGPSLWDDFSSVIAVAVLVSLLAGLLMWLARGRRGSGGQARLASFADQLRRRLAVAEGRLAQ